MGVKAKTSVILLGVIAVAVSFAAFLAISSYNKAANKGYGEPTQTIDFTIEAGESIDEIAQNLLDAGLITNVYFFQIYVRQYNIADRLQAGAFKIPDNLSLKDLTDILQHAVFPDVWVTIPEGLRATEISAILEEAFSGYAESSFDKTEFMALVENPVLPEGFDNPAPKGEILEGYLFPDTYRFPPDATAEYVIISMLTTFDEKLTRPNIDEIETLSSRYTVDDLVTLASILERESMHAEDRPLVADILLRRIENGWALEVDVTLLYYFGDWKRDLSYIDLQEDTQYNTRKYSGLPPTPISNPGAQAFEAILNPEPNDYWFFIADSEGILHYASTLEEHNANISMYLQ